jgi:rhamnosyltransferase
VTRNKVAIIMRSKNEMPYVRPALEMLARQSFRDFDLFVVDSGSSDGSLAVLREFCPPERLREIHPEEYIPGKVLNEMIAAVDHEFIVFQNADSIPLAEDWLERLLDPLLRGDCDASMSRQEARADARFIVKYDYRRAYDPANIKADNADFFSAVACAFRRQLWESHKFRTHGYAEDVAWASACRRDGARFLLLQDSAVEHSHNYSLKGLHRKKFRHGITFAEIYGASPSLVQSLYKCSRELLRDLLYALRRLRLDTIPYNIVYRIVIHHALYRGLKAGRDEIGAAVK